MAKITKGELEYTVHTEGISKQGKQGQEYMHVPVDAWLDIYVDGVKHHIQFQNGGGYYGNDYACLMTELEIYAEATSAEVNTVRNDILEEDLTEDQKQLIEFVNNLEVEVNEQMGMAMDYAIIEHNETIE